jgi:hypothetical protein
VPETLYCCACSGEASKLRGHSLMQDYRQGIATNWSKLQQICEIITTLVMTWEHILALTR